MKPVAAERLRWTDAMLARLDLPTGPLHVTLGVGSGLFRRASDPPGRVWAIGDRGPNIKIGPAIRDHGLAHLAPLLDVEGAKVMPRPDLAPRWRRCR
jgi:hypothetical protein